MIAMTMMIAHRTGSRQVRILTPATIDEQFVAEWEQLADNALEANFFLTPAFVLGSLDHFNLPEPRIVAVYNGDGQLSGLGVFSRNRGAKQMPLEHWSAYRCPHTFLTGLLIDRSNPKDTIETFFQFARTHKINAIEFRQLAASSTQGKLIFEVAEQHGVEWFAYDRYERGLLAPAEIDQETYFNEVLSYKRRKTIRRSQRKLEQLGQLDLVHYRADQLDDDVVQRFLDLEHLGWKGKHGSSLASNRQHQAFFRYIVQAAKGRDQAIFTELLLDGQAIASTSNFISGNAAFAFKVGWEPKFEQYSPGILHEVALVVASKSIFPDVEYIDSCTERDSFLEKLWPNRRTITSGYFAITAVGRLCLSAMHGLRRLKQCFYGSSTSLVFAAEELECLSQVV